MEGLEGRGQALIGSDRSPVPDVAVLARGRWKDSRRCCARADVLQVHHACADEGFSLSYVFDISCCFTI